MKVELELPPGVYPTDAEVQELLKKFQEIKAATFKCKLRRLLLEGLNSSTPSNVKASELSIAADASVDIAIVAFSDLVQSIELKGPPDIYREEVEEFKREILSRLK